MGESHAVVCNTGYRDWYASRELAERAATNLDRTEIACGPHNVEPWYRRDEN